jgi:uncharacterized protein (DUF433 family)
MTRSLFVLRTLPVEIRKDVKVPDMAASQTESGIITTGRGLTLAGTRITLYDIMGYLKEDWPPKLIRQWLNLTEEQIADAMAYIAAHRDEVEAEYRLVIEQAEANRAYWEERNREIIARIRELPPRPGKEALIEKLRARKAELGMP